MRIEIPTAYHFKIQMVPPSELTNINQKLDQLLMKASEAIQVLGQVKDQLGKASDEILAKISALQQSDPDLSPEGQAVVEELKAKAQALDDIVPDAPPAAG